MSCIFMNFTGQMLADSGFANLTLTDKINYVQEINRAMFRKEISPKSVLILMHLLFSVNHICILSPKKSKNITCRKYC